MGSIQPGGEESRLKVALTRKKGKAFPLVLQGSLLILNQADRESRSCLMELIHVLPKWTAGVVGRFDKPL